MRLWLPDSVLLCTLLLVPRKNWWFYVLVTAPARFVPAFRAPAPAWFLWANWINDVGKALLAAYLLQRTSRISLFKRIRGYAIYLGVAVILTPSISAFFGALVRLTLRHPFWPAFGQWYLGDALANLVITPTLLLWVSHEYRHLRPVGLEAAVWAAGFVLCLGITARSSWFHESVLALYAPFPFLIWAASRLRAIGASTGLSITTIFVISGMSHSKGPFSPIAHDMHFLALFLAVLALPILFVATLFEERHATEARLREKQDELNRNYERIRGLAAGLIQAQEEERNKISRELHDDVVQRLALLAIDLELLDQEVPTTMANTHSSLLELKERTEEATAALRELSHELHSSTLQYVGLPEALVGLGRTVSERHQISVKVHADQVRRSSYDLDLCLFRVAQEALSNAAKHSKAHEVTLRLAQTGSEYVLEITDDGVGFSSSMESTGLGLVSMRERVHLVNGTIAVESKAMAGTRIRVRVPAQ